MRHEVYWNKSSGREGHFKQYEIIVYESGLKRFILENPGLPSRGYYIESDKSQFGIDLYVWICHKFSNLKNLYLWNLLSLSFLLAAEPRCKSKTTIQGWYSHISIRLTTRRIIHLKAWFCSRKRMNMKNGSEIEIEIEIEMEKDR